MKGRANSSPRPSPSHRSIPLRRPALGRYGWASRGLDRQRFDRQAWSQRSQRQAHLESNGTFACEHLKPVPIIATCPIASLNTRQTHENTGPHYSQVGRSRAGRDARVWKEFEPIACSAGFAFATYPKPGSHFAEALVAKDLLNKGYTDLWQGSIGSLFHFKKLKGQAKKQTARLERMLAGDALPRPGIYRDRLNCSSPFSLNAEKKDRRPRNLTLLRDTPMGDGDLWR